MEQLSVERKGISQELNFQEQQLIQKSILEFLSQRKAGPLDRKYFPLNEQIVEEESVIQNADYTLDEGLHKFRKFDFLSKLANYSWISYAKNLKLLLQRRLNELNHLWTEEDKRVRKESGCQWDDLNEVIRLFDIVPVDENKLKRPNIKNLSGIEDPHSAKYSSYYIDSTIKKTRPIGHPLEGTQVPAHTVEIFGNEVEFSEEDFDEIIKKHSLEDQVRYQISQQNIDSVTSLPTFGCRVVAPYKNWLLISQAWHYGDDETPHVPKDESQKFEYWDKSLLPKKLILTK